jgi:diguanylate cyclase (GGDEF)-like protein/PAS domain S-box-containing protein
VSGKEKEIGEPGERQVSGEAELALLASTFESASIGMALIELGRDGGPERVVRVNPALVEITGFPKQDLIGAGARILGLDSHSRAAESFRSVGAGPSRVEFEHTFERPDRSRMWVMVTLSPILDGSDGSNRYRLAQIQDISDRRDYQSRLQFLAEHDPLTGLVNARRLYETIDKGIAYQLRYGGDAALLSLDLDRFKLVNDSWGHAVGDEVLRRFGAILKEKTRESDSVARLGGDEFAVFLPGVDEAGATSVAEEILTYIRSHPITLETEGVEGITLSTSGGVTELRGREDVSARELLAEADSALYAAKRAGRNCVVGYGFGGGEAGAQSRRLTWAERTRRALDRDALFLEVQPIRSLQTGEILRQEALLRMNDPDVGIAYPPTFLYTAERFGLSLEIDRWVVETVIEALAKSADPSASVAVNLTAASLDLSSDLLEWLPERLDSTGVDPGRIGFELTEGTCLTDIERARLFVEGVHRIGCTVALDDFGAGFGGFYYLKMLPVDILKIDGEFIRSVNASREDRLIVKAVSDMANGLGIEVVAEFVTSEAIAETCRDLGLSAIQGSFAGPTLPLNDALEID